MKTKSKEIESMGNELEDLIDGGIIQNNDIQIIIQNNDIPIMEFCGTGKIYIKGKLVYNDKEVVDIMKNILNKEDVNVATGEGVKE